MHIRFCEEVDTIMLIFPQKYLNINPVRHVLRGAGLQPVIGHVALKIEFGYWKKICHLRKRVFRNYQQSSLPKPDDGVVKERLEL